MKRIEWENYQDGDSTPLNAENLNLMQANIETAIEFQHQLILKLIDYRFDKDVLWEIDLTEQEKSEDLEQRNKDLAIMIIKIKKPELEENELVATKVTDNVYQILTYKVNIKTYEITED